MERTDVCCIKCERRLTVATLLYHKKNKTPNLCFSCGIKDKTMPKSVKAVKISKAKERALKLKQAIAAQKAESEANKRRFYLKNGGSLG